MNESARFEVGGSEHIGTLRQGLAGLLGRHSVDLDTVYDVQLAASELVTNGLSHGHAERVDVHATVSDDRIEMVVEHQVGRRSSATIRPVGEGGRGLSIVRAIATEFSIDQCGTHHSASVVFGRPVSATAVRLTSSTA